MTCCDHCQDSGDLFNREKAEKELRKYRKNGPPNKSTRLLIDALRSLDIEEKTLLDIGGGVGMIQHELLNEGIAESTLVEASPAYLEVAENESRRRGHADRTSHHYGDFVDRAPDLPEADIVTLDRVYCCYPYMKRLAEASTAKAKQWYGVVYPKERWYIRALGNLGNAYCWARGMEFRMYLHTGIDEIIRERGFTRFYQVETILWTVALYERAQESV
jgi:magnesium-protoporphyrin O-methyltransferase